MTRDMAPLERVYVLAIAQENAGKRPLESFCKCNRVLQRVTQLLQIHEPLLDAWLLDETLQVTEAQWPLVDALYGPFVAAVHSGVVCEGQGNFGGRDEYGEWAPAHPKFLEVRLTAEGLRLAQSLQA